MIIYKLNNRNAKAILALLEENNIKWITGELPSKIVPYSGYLYVYNNSLLYSSKLAVNNHETVA